MCSVVMRRKKYLLIPAMLLAMVAGPGASKGYGQDLMLKNIRLIEKSEIRCNILSDDYFGYTKGDIPILISAPHGAKHYRTREKFWKAEDAYTSAIAIELGRLTGAHVLYLKNRAPEDPNNDAHTRYKDFLASVVKENGIKFIIDLHGSSADRPFKIDVGILEDSAAKSSCPTFRMVIANALRNFEASPFNQHFRAADAATITSFAKHTLGIEAAQIEINARYRMVESDRLADERNLIDLMNCLQALIVDINQRVRS